MLFVGGIVFAATALLIEDAARRAPGAATVLRAAGVLGASLSLLAAAQSVWPFVGLQPAAEDPPETRKLTELRHLGNAGWDIGPMTGVWAPLDEMTRRGAGLSVYQAGNPDVFWTAPTFGTELQNRIWNFEQAPTREPDAFFFHSPGRTPLYIGRAIPRAAVAADPRYRLVAAAGDGAMTLYVSAAALAEKGRDARLAEYYRLTAPSVVKATAPTVAGMTAGSVVLVPFPLAAGYLVHKADAALFAEVQPIVAADLEAAVQRVGRGRVIYTLDTAISGMNQRTVATFSRAGKVMTLIQNEPVRGSLDPVGAEP